jgi:hypothetical protein
VIVYTRKTADRSGVTKPSARIAAAGNW